MTEDANPVFASSERDREVYGTGIVGPTGLAHIAVYESTLCGHDATGPDWWWPL